MLTNNKNKIAKSALLILAIAALAIGFLLINHKKQKSLALKIGILQFIEHDCLDEAREGFVARLAELGYKDGENVEIDFKNASGDQSICNQMATKFANDKKNLILGIATPAAQALANATKSIPILFTAVTAPDKNGLVDSNEKPGGNITGTSDSIPIEKQTNLINQIFPDAKNVGILYCSGEANSKIQADLAIAELEKSNMQGIAYTVSNSTEIAQVIDSMPNKKIDVIFVPTDNLIVANMPLVSQTAIGLGIPIVCSERNSVKNGALAAYCISYYKLGERTADQAAKILKCEARPESMPIESLSQSEIELTLNPNVAEKQGITIPEELAKDAKRV
jgi:putative ABC transport system substrate-binding protein